MFPAGRFVSLWHPYKVMAVNIKYIAEKRVVQVTYRLLGAKGSYLTLVRVADRIL